MLFISRSLRIIAIFAALFMLAGTACKRPSIARTWINATPKLHDVSKVKILYNCGEKPIKAYDPLSASLWIIKSYTKCPRAHCTLGRAKGIRDEDGTIRVTYSTFLAIRNMIIFDEGGLLRVKIQNNYRDPKRPNEEKTFYLQPEGQ